MGIPAAWSLLNFWTANSELRIRIWDPDVVQLSNLHRQVLYSCADIGSPKVDTLVSKLTPLAERSGAKLEARAMAVDRTNIAELADSDLIIDATDSVETKFLLNDFAVERSIPFCYGGAVGYHGQLLLSDPKNESCGCLRCLFADFPAEEMEAQGPTCREAGILGPVVGHIGFLQGELAAGLLAGLLDLSAGSNFYRFDLRTGRSYQTFVRQSPDCPIHSKPARPRVLDLTAKECPSTFLYTKLALEQIATGSELEVHFGNRESAANVSETAAAEGFKVRGAPEEFSRGRWRVIIGKVKHG